MRIAIFGAGYVGLVSGACLASIGHHVICVDVSEQRVSDINSGKSPIYELGLDALLDGVRKEERFSATLNAKAALEASELSMIAVGTPPKDGKIDLSYVLEVARTIGAHIRTSSKRHTVVVKSTVVPGTTAGIVRQTLEEASGKIAGKDFGLAMNPEFLREGTAIEDFMEPDRIVVGAIDEASSQSVANLYERFKCPVMAVSPTNAEFIKYASNTLLATLVSFSNELYRLCEATPGADGESVMDGLALDKRLSPTVNGKLVSPGILTYLRGGIGYGGSCLPKDISALQLHAKAKNVKMPLLDSVMQVNEDRPAAVIEMVEREVGGSLQGKVIAVLGLAFKAGTDDLRFSPTLPLVWELVRRGAKVRALDPQATEGAKDVFGDKIEYAYTSDVLLRDADCALLATSWPEFRDWNWTALLGTMKAPLVVDGRNALRQVKWPANTRYVSVGRG
jgi:UDPglucose 6-dehydrogenase